MNLHVHRKFHINCYNWYVEKFKLITNNLYTPSFGSLGPCRKTQKIKTHNFSPLSFGSTT